jgi:hypothetical protein
MMDKRSLGLSGYRVVARSKHRQLALVSLAETRTQAVGLAEEFLQTVQRRRLQADPRSTGEQDSIQMILVEQWIGTPTVGYWKPLSAEAGGFWHRVNGSPRGRRVEVDPALPRSGDEVLCVLLPEKTRKGGWRARLSNRSLAGPITNTGDVPSGVQAGQRVVLLVEAISGKKGRVQFRWMPGRSAEG